MKKYIFSFLGIALVLGGLWWYEKDLKKTEIKPTVTQNNSEVQIEEIKDLNIQNENGKIKSPFTISGKARGYWFFEASFPVKVLDANNVVLGTGIATANGDWMTENFVGFTTTISFSNPLTPNGFLVFEKDNPSGLPENSKQYKLRVQFTAP